MVLYRAASSFDHLVGGGEQCYRNFDPNNRTPRELGPGFYLFGLARPRTTQQIGKPAARRVLVAEAEDGERDWHPDEGAEQPPQEGPKEDREQHDHWRHRQ